MPRHTRSPTSALVGALLGCLATILSGAASAERVCVDTLSNAASGTLTDSGGSGGNYADNEFCGFWIQPSGGGDITLTFSAFDYESGWDFLRIYDGTGTSDPLIADLTGTSLPASVTATSGTMLVVSDTDFIFTRAGFEATWSTVAPGPPPACPDPSVADNFPSVAYDQDAGTQDWATDWLEIGESDGPSSGIARVNGSLCTAGNCIRIGEPGSSGSSWTDRGLQREVDLGNATSAQLQFNYYVGYAFGSSAVELGVSADGGVSWTTLATYNLTGSQFSATAQTFDLTPYMTDSTRIRFLSDGSSARVGLYVDDIEISFEEPCLPPDPVAEWRFDELNWSGAAGEVVDSSASALDAAAVNGANTINDGQVCRAGGFDGVDQRVAASVQSTLTETASLSFWLRTPSVGSTAAPTLTLLSPAHYDVGTLALGELTYVDRPYTYTDIPAEFQGLPVIRTGNDDKLVDIDLRFSLSAPGAVYVAWDPRETNLPSWLDGFELTSHTIDNTDGATFFQVYRRNFSAGEVSFGGAGFTVNTRTMYLVFVDALVSDASDPAMAPGVTGVVAGDGGNNLFWGWLDEAGLIGLQVGGTVAKSTSVVADGSWHHVVLTRNDDSGALRVYVDGTLEDSNTGPTSVTGSSFASLGRFEGTTNDAHFAGDLDEVLVFDETLDADQVATLFGFQQAGLGWDGGDRACVVNAHIGFQIGHDSAGIHCLAEPLAVAALNTDGNVHTTYTGGIVLDTGTGDGTWALAGGAGSFNDATAGDGLATYQFAAADNGQASFALTYSQGASPIDVEVYDAIDNTLRDDDSEGALLFAPSGLTVTASALSNPPASPIVDPVGDQVAGVNYALHLTAYGTTDDDPECGVIESYSGNRALKFWTEHLDPGSGTVAARIDGLASAGSAAAASAQTVAFSAGQAAVTARYDDAGSVRLQMQDDTSFSHVIGGASAPHVVRPAELRIVAVTSNSGTANPAPASLDGAGFVASGEPFTVRVEARNALGGVTANFGNESAAESLVLSSPALVAPAGGRHGSSGDISGGSSLAPVAAGVYESTTISYDEVGIITLQAAVADGDYLGSGALLGPTSGNVGRFYPADFALSNPQVSAACSGYTYFGQPGLTVGYELRARATDAATLQNYDAALLGSARVAAVALSAENADGGMDLGARLSAAAGTWSGGVLSVLDTAAGFSRLASPDGPYDNLQIGLSLSDPLGDSALSGLDTDAASTGSCAGACTAVALGGPTRMRFGRLLVLPGTASELTDLSVPLQAQYFDGAGFVDHAGDACSEYAASAVALSAFTGDLDPGETTAIGPATTTPLVLGRADALQPLQLRAPGDGNAGTVRLTLDVAPWLEYPSGAEPSGVQEFGRYRGHDRIVWRREQY